MSQHRNKKFLLISYYWPPMGGGGVQRWLKMSKYFHQFGWNPVVYTVEADESIGGDNSLLDEVRNDTEIIRSKIFEPHGIYALITGQKKGKSKYSGFITKKKTGLAYKFSLFIRSNFFIPDARMFWIKPSIKQLKNWLKENKVDAIISTGPPHSTHMIALGIKKAFPEIPWIADFRDPWTDIDFYHELSMMPFADRKHKRLEKKILQTADKVVTVTWNFKHGLAQLCGRNDIELIFNGFDPEDFTQFESKPTGKFRICHLGSMNKHRNPDALWSSLSQLVKNNKSFASNLDIQLIGPVDVSITDSLKQYGLESFTSFKDFIPHKEAIEFLQSCDLLLLPINQTRTAQGILPGKLYEYLATKKPILAIGPDQSDIAKVLSEFDNCLLAAYEDEQSIKEFILTTFENGSSSTERDIAKYSRKTHAETYASLLDGLMIG